MTMIAAAEATSNKRNATNLHEDVAILPGYNVTTTASGASSKTSHFETDLHGNVNILLGGWVKHFYNRYSGNFQTRLVLDPRELINNRHVFYIIFLSSDFLRTFFAKKR